MRRVLAKSLALVALVSLGAGPAPAAAEALVRLQGTRPAALGQAVQLGALDPALEIAFAFTLPVRDPAGLDAFLKSVYTPGDPLYRRYLKTGEFAGRFGPTQADYDAVIAFAQAQGLRVVATHSNRAVLDVTGPVAAIERALGVHMLRYRSATGRLFRAPDSEPALPASIAARVAGIVDLDDAEPPKPNVREPAPGAGRRTTTASPNMSGTGPNNGISPTDIRKVYNLNGIAQNGTGETIALFELDGYTAGDITAYEDQFSLPHVTLTNILLNNVSGTPTAPTAQVPYPTGPLEVTLDIELAIALAPGVSAIRVYEGTSITDIYNRIASDNNASQVSSSWYYGLDSATPAATRNAENTAFQQMAAQGQSFFAATGDFGDKVKTGTDVNGNPILAFGVQDPTSQPYVTAVGGTVVTDSASGAWQSETAWNGSGGGISTVWTIPTYQSLVVSPGSGGSSTWRNLPDVSLDSNSGYSIYCFGTWFGTVNGTSCASPLWAAFTALVNQYRGGAGLAQAGFLNPTLHYLAQSATSASDFHDITTGNNGTYPAVTGFDNVTGWGTLNGGNLFKDLRVNVTAFWVDGSFNGLPQNGSATNPFKTIAAAVNAAPADQPTLIYIRGNNYLENPTLGKRLLLVNNGGGVVRIGN